MKRLAYIVPTILCVAAAPQPDIQARVASVSGRSVYLSAGRNAGVRSGARVVFRLRNGQLVESTISDVTSNNARAEIEDGLSLPVAGDTAEIEAPEPVTSPPESGGASDGASNGGSGQITANQPIPEHPPWQLKEGQRNPDTPLLSPAFGTRPEDRPMTVTGRVYSTLRLIKDLEHENEYLYARTGLWLEAKNPLGNGGRLRFQGDAQYRGVSGPYDDDSEGDGRVHRFSYAWGLDENAPFRGEIGRFFSAWLPELGIVDGGEGALRFENGLSLGAGAGYYPSTTEDLLGGDDYGFHVFADYQPDTAERVFQGTIGFQQTFHEGEADRSLVVGRVIANPTDDIRLFGLIMVDLYGSEDTIETSTAEITQLLAQASFRLTPTSGALASVIHTSWPELKRSEFDLFPPELIADGYVDRVSGTYWTKLDDDWRLSTRGHYWRDQSRTGYGGEVGLDWSLPTETPSSLLGAIYYEDSAYTTGAGLRLQTITDLGGARLFVGYDGFAYTTDTETSGSNDFLRHSIRSDIGWGTGQWYWDIEGSYSFGGEEQSFTIGASVQYRF